MKADKIVQFLECLGVTNAQKTKRAGWVISRCPLGPWRHNDGVSGPEVFGVKDEQGDPHCNCFACGYHGTLGGLIQTVAHFRKEMPIEGLELHLGKAQDLVYEAEESQEFDFDIPGIEDVLNAAANKFVEFPEWWLATFPCAWDVDWARSYLHERHVPLDVAARLDIRCDPNQGRLCFPVRDFAGTLMGLHGRAVIEETEPRYRMYTYAKKNNPLVWLGEKWVDLNRPIVVVEGPFDLTSVMRVYDNVVSPLFATPSKEKIRRMSDCLEWVTLLDRGAGGDAGRARIEETLGSDHVIHHLQPPKGCKDPGAMNPVQVADLLSHHVPLIAFCT